MAFETIPGTVRPLVVAGLLAGLAVGTPFATAPSAHADPPAKKPGAKKPPAGGANQVEGLNGKVGQMLFDGKWRFQVQSVQEGLTTYTLKATTADVDYAMYHQAAEEDKHTFTAKEGNTFVAIKCLAKNAQNKMEQLDFLFNDPKTALADDQGGSYPPIFYDMLTKSGASITKPMLPGSSEEMTIVFAVPPGTKLKDLVVTLKNYDDHKGHDVRVSLPPTPTPPVPPAPSKN